MAAAAAAPLSNRIMMDSDTQTTTTEQVDSAPAQAPPDEGVTNLIVVVVDHVPETVKEHSRSSNNNNNSNNNSPRNSTTPTPETLSVLTDSDESLEHHHHHQQLLLPTTAASTSTTKRHASSKIQAWCGTKLYSDLVMEGLEWLKTVGAASSSSSKNSSHPSDNVHKRNHTDNVVMVYESPSTANPHSGSSFYNESMFPFYDYPLTNNDVKSILAPLRYAAMTGNACWTYLQSPPPPGLLEHWSTVIPNITMPKFCHEILPSSDTTTTTNTTTTTTTTSSWTVWAYLPLQQVEEQRHMIAPQIHYQLAGKDDIPHMTSLTTCILPDMSTKRPCIVKVTHCMGSKGIFVIRNDDDERHCRDYLASTGSPAFVVTDFVDIERNLAVHFFLHPNGTILWFGTSENLLDQDGIWSADATIHSVAVQDELQQWLSPYVQDVADYCLQRGYWGACGIDVLMERNGRGYVVDVNPRVTGTCPAMMVFQQFVKKTDPPSFCRVGIFRRSKKYAYPGSRTQLFQHVQEYNTAHVDTRIVIFSALERTIERESSSNNNSTTNHHNNNTITYINIGVYGVTQVRCIKVLNKFAVKLR